ncbi:hypothetical protein DY000_02052480 [Brassica cretica]|uniref:Uncharacterized protein n=1 Tax=Brassica cretica TaxID=69181 RepID=A0ABQ7AM68_BRACR|nr:hypothetical protein DY000_02052480 [Brassica cretica]
MGEWSTEECVEKGVLVICTGVSGYVKAGSIDGFLSMEVGEAEVSVGCDTDNFAGVGGFEEVWPGFGLAAFAYDKGGNSARAEKVLVV